MLKYLLNINPKFFETFLEASIRLLVNLRELSNQYFLLPIFSTLFVGY